MSETDRLQKHRVRRYAPTPRREKVQAQIPDLKGRLQTGVKPHKRTYPHHHHPAHGEGSDYISLARMEIMPTRAAALTIPSTPVHEVTELAVSREAAGALALAEVCHELLARVSKMVDTVQIEIGNHLCGTSYRLAIIEALLAQILEAEQQVAWLTAKAMEKTRTNASEKPKALSPEEVGAAGFAHACKSPLTVIESNVELAQGELRHAELALAMPREELDWVSLYVSQVKKAVRKVTVFRDEAVTLAKTGKVEIHPVALKPFLEASVRNNEHYLHSGCPNFGVDYEPEVEMFKVMATEPELTRIIDVLLQNVAEAKAHCLTFGAKQVGDRVLLTVKDDGPGMAPEVLAQIFEGFSTKDGGHGIGLPEARKAVERINGQISAESKKGEGTTFTIELQVAA